MTAWERLKARALWLLGILAALLPVIGYVVGRVHGAGAERARTTAANADAVRAGAIEEAQRTIADVERERQVAAQHAEIDRQTVARIELHRPATVADARAAEDAFDAEMARRGGGT